MVSIPITGGRVYQPGGGERSGGRGRGRGGGSGRSGRGEKNDEVARERAFKEKHKSSNRKRGKDKKMVKAGDGPSA